MDNINSKDSKKSQTEKKAKKKTGPKHDKAIKNSFHICFNSTLIFS